MDPLRGRIRPYQQDDEAPVAAVWHRSGQNAYPFLPTWQAFEADQARRVFREVIVSHCDLWVAELDAQLVAYLAMKASTIDRLYVDPVQQRHGWGTRLIEHAKRAQPRGLSLHTHQENHAARAFYEMHGFVAVRFGTSPPPERAPDVEYHWRPSGAG